MCRWRRGRWPRGICQHRWCCHFFFTLHYFMSIYWRLSFASSGSAALLTWSAIAALSVVHPLCCLRIRVHVWSVQRLDCDSGMYLMSMALSKCQRLANCWFWFAVCSLMVSGFAQSGAALRHWWQTRWWCFWSVNVVVLTISCTLHYYMLSNWRLSFADWPGFCWSYFQQISSVIVFFDV